jgi:hypothetical protein
VEEEADEDVAIGCDVGSALSRKSDDSKQVVCTDVRVCAADSSRAVICSVDGDSVGGIWKLRPGGGAGS